MEQDRLIGSAAQDDDRRMIRSRHMQASSAPTAMAAAADPVALTESAQAPFDGHRRRMRAGL
jgi:hypothetical protein